jgi:hypothetical protein
MKELKNPLNIPIRILLIGFKNRIIMFSNSPIMLLGKLEDPWVF